MMVTSFLSVEVDGEPHADPPTATPLTKQPKGDDEMNPSETKILDVIGNIPLTVSEICDETGISATTVRKGLKSLIDSELALRHDSNPATFEKVLTFSLETAVEQCLSRTKARSVDFVQRRLVTAGVPATKEEVAFVLVSLVALSRAETPFRKNRYRRV